MPCGAWRTHFGGALRSRHLAPAPQRRCRLHLRGFGCDLRRAAGARGHRRVGGVRGGPRNGRAGSQRGGRHLLAGQPASGAPGHPHPGAGPILRRRGGLQGVALDGAGGSTLDDADTRDSCRVDPYRRNTRRTYRGSSHARRPKNSFTRKGSTRSTLSDARRMRLVAAEEGIPGVLWAVLIFAGIAAIGFTYLFGLENTWAQI